MNKVIHLDWNNDIVERFCAYHNIEYDRNYMENVDKILEKEYGLVYNDWEKHSLVINHDKFLVFLMIHPYFIDKEV